MKKSRIFSVFAFLLFLAATGLVFYFLYRSQMLSMRLLIIGAVLFFIVVMLLAFLVFKAKSSFLIISGGVLCLLFGAVLLYAGIVSTSGLDTAQSIFSGETKKEVSYLYVYMLKDETDEDTKLSADMSYGILRQDEANTKEVIGDLEAEFNSTLKTKSYEGPTRLIDALRDHEVDAIILNTAFLPLIEDTEGYENISDSLRSVSKLHTVEREVPTKETGKKPAKTGSEGAELSKEEDDQCFIVYISGIDTRLNDLVENSRSDTNILAIVNPMSHQILLLTTPRDYYVPLKFPDFVSSRDKLTHAGIYGVQVSMDTLGMLYDIDVDYYFRVNFNGFVDIVEAMGGVTVYVEKEFSTTEYTFKQGPNELNGYKALSFVRNRFGIGDQQRGRNQMAFVKGVINKATSTDMLLNFNSILKAVDGCFESSMPYDVISALVREQIETGAEWNVVTYAVTGTGNSAIPYSMNIEVYVMDPDMSTVETAKGLIQQVLAGDILTQP